MKKLLILFGLIFILTGCSEVKNYKAVLVDKDMNKQKAYNILIENKSFTVNEDSSELLISLTNQDNDNVYIESLKVIFKDTSDNEVYSKNIFVDKTLDKNQIYDLNIKCDKSFPEVSDFEYEIRAK